MRQFPICRLTAISSNGTRTFTQAGHSKAVAEAIQATLLEIFPVVLIENEPFTYDDCALIMFTRPSPPELPTTPAETQVNSVIPA
jgi:hypothetical protein